MEKTIIVCEQRQREREGQEERTIEKMMQQEVWGKGHKEIQGKEEGRGTGMRKTVC